MPSLQFLFDFLLIVFTVFSIGFVYVLKVVGYQLGEETVRGGLKLYTGGCVTWKRISVWPKVSVEGPSVRQLRRIGGQTVFECDRITLDTATISLPWILLGRPVNVYVEKPWLNMQLDPASHLPEMVELLMDVGLVRELKDYDLTMPRRREVDLELADDEDEDDESDEELKAAHLEEWGLAEEPSLTSVVTAAAQPSGPPSASGSDVEGDGLDRGVGTRLDDRQWWTQRARMNMSGRVTAWNVVLHLVDGQMIVPDIMRQCLGESIRMTGAFGTPAILQETAALQISSTDWLAQEQWPEASRLTGRPLMPIVTRIEATHMGTTIMGWRTTTGILLKEDMTANLDFTPALVKYFLSRMAPLVAGTVRLEEDDSVTVRISPLCMHIPASTYVLNVQPLRLQMAGNALVTAVLNFLTKFRDKETTKPGQLEAWTSRIVADLHRSGRMDTHRMDIIISRNFTVSTGPIHLAMWGKADIQNDDGLDMTLALFADTMALLGIRDLPDDFVMRLHVKGSAMAPQIQFLKATRHVLELLCERNLGSIYGMGRLKNWLESRRSKRVHKYGGVPEPQRPLPWDVKLKRQFAPGRHTLSKF